MRILNYYQFINEVFDLVKTYSHMTDKAKDWEKSRYSEYYDKLNREYDDTYKHSDFQKIWKILERDCKPFLEEIKKSNSDLIFRGVHKDLDNNVTYGMDKKAVRRNRYSKDMNPEIQQLFDDKFAEKFGVRLRSECIFASKDPLTAMNYSGHSQEISRKRKQPYLFFPIGDFNYYWNPDVYDLFTQVEDVDWYYKWFYLEGGDIGDYDLGYEKSDWFSIYGNPDEKSGGWNDVKGGGKGKIIDGEWVPDLSFEDYLEEVKEKIQSNAEEEIKKIVDGYKQGGLTDIKHQEITFDCDEYYLVDDVFLYKILKKIKRMK